MRHSIATMRPENNNGEDPSQEPSPSVFPAAIEASARCDYSRFRSNRIPSSSTMPLKITATSPAAVAPAGPFPPPLPA